MHYDSTVQKFLKHEFLKSERISGHTENTYFNSNLTVKVMVQHC